MMVTAAAARVSVASGQNFDAAQPVYVEAESRKVGGLRVPEELINAMRRSPCIVLDTAAGARVTLLLREYAHFLGDPRELKAKLDCLAGLQSKETLARWKDQIEQGLWAELVADLLANHYDPAYHRATRKNFAQLGEARVLRPDKLDATAIAQMAGQLIADETK